MKWLILTISLFLAAVISIFHALRVYLKILAIDEG